MLQAYAPQKELPEDFLWPNLMKIAEYIFISPHICHFNTKLTFSYNQIKTREAHKFLISLGTQIMYHFPIIWAYSLSSKYQAQLVEGGGRSVQFQTFCKNSLIITEYNSLLKKSITGSLSMAIVVSYTDFIALVPHDKQIVSYTDFIVFVPPDAIKSV